MQDIEVILRGYAMLLNGARYKPPLGNFLNDFSEEAKKFHADRVEHLKKIFSEFISKVNKFPAAFKVNKKFNIALFEAVFVAACSPALSGGSIKNFSSIEIRNILKDEEFRQAL